jgi:hypothetical protein
MPVTENHIPYHVRRGLENPDFIVEHRTCYADLRFSWFCSFFGQIQEAAAGDINIVFVFLTTPYVYQTTASIDTMNNELERIWMGSGIF